MATDDVYAYCATLARDQWAWEFLRRNPEYQSDYQQFIAIWLALEADYGAPPHRDFLRWKQDPRAYGPLDHTASATQETCSSDLCIGDNDQVFLECWMGAKWGFHKFPLDPARLTPPAPDELSWRAPPIAAPRPVDDPYRFNVVFDLSLPLPPQLDAAKFRLVSQTSVLRRSGLVAPITVASQRVRWTRMLQLLDAEVFGESALENNGAMLREAHELVNGGYLGILRLADIQAD